MSITAHSARYVARMDNNTEQPNGGQSIQTRSESRDPVSCREGCQPADIHRQIGATYVAARPTEAQWLCMF